ncbi:MAG: globin domain-containing protein [Phycisphaerales bacterium]
MRITRHPLLAPTGGLRAIPADEAIIARLESSFAIVAADGTFAARFQDRLFAEHPELRPMFPADLTALRRKLADTLATVVGTLRQPQQLRATLHALGKRHAAYGARNEHYPIIVRHLVGGLADALGPRWSPDLEREWTQALELVAATMIEGGRMVS